MVTGSAPLLESIPKLVARRDAASLVALQDHDDKQVRKAVRKAIHTLRSKGVEIPAAEGARSWSAGDIQELRGDLRDMAIIDMDSMPGLTRVMISAPQEERAYLWVAAIGGRDQIIDFVAYVQTDGQRARMVREWKDMVGGREVPLAWARARILWAREQTLSSGYSVPRKLDEMLVHLGEPPAARPRSFIADQLSANGFVGGKDNVDPLLRAVRVFAWPPLFDVEPIVRKVSEMLPSLSEGDPEDKRYAAIQEAAHGSADLRETLKGQVANLLDDGAINLWLHGNEVPAAQVRALADELRTVAEPEALPWIGRLIAYQINSTLTYLAQQKADSRPQ